MTHSNVRPMETSGGGGRECARAIRTSRVDDKSADQTSRHTYVEFTPTNKRWTTRPLEMDRLASPA